MGRARLSPPGKGTAGPPLVPEMPYASPAFTFGATSENRTVTQMKTIPGFSRTRARPRPTPDLLYRCVTYQRSPLAAKVRIRSAVRQAIAWIVSDGLTPPTVGNTEPSQIHRLGMSQLRQSALTTLVRGSSPMRAVPFRWQVSSF